MLGCFFFSFFFCITVVLSFLLVGVSFNLKWLLCQGCSGSRSRVSPRHRGRCLLSGAGRDLRPLPPPPAGQTVSRGAAGSAL